MQTLSELIACFCTVFSTEHIDKIRLATTVRMFHERWLAESTKLLGTTLPKGTPQREQVARTLGMLTWMVALFVEHANLDDLRKDLSQNGTSVPSCVR